MQAPTVHTEKAKEEAKWEQFERDCPRGLSPGNPYVKRLYPWMLYKAHQMPNGKFAVSQDEPTFFGFRDANEWQRAKDEATRFTTSCQRTVMSETEHERARADGWRNSPQEALDFQASLQKLMGDEAARQNFADKNMSEKALEEKRKLEADHFGHLPEIPAQPIVRRVKRKYTKKSADSAAA